MVIRSFFQRGSEEVARSKLLLEIRFVAATVFVPQWRAASQLCKIEFVPTGN